MYFTSAHIFSETYTLAKARLKTAEETSNLDSDQEDVSNISRQHRRGRGFNKIYIDENNTEFEEQAMFKEVHNSEPPSLPDGFSGQDSQMVLCESNQQQQINENTDQIQSRKHGRINPVPKNL